MSYSSEQYKNTVKYKESLQIADETKYTITSNGKTYRHILKNTELNLWEGIRGNALAYFREKGIHWHKNTIEGNPETIPEGDLLSSQISCVNHLYCLRNNKELATAILNNIDNRIVSAEIVNDGYGDDGYVEFEVSGTKNNDNPLNEKSRHRSRGEKSTSIDAIMIGKKGDGKNILIFIEWKYTEDYTKVYDNKNKCKYIEGYHDYHLLFNETNCPVHKYDNFQDLYYDPFYQLMRQTLLGWKMVEKNEFDCDEFIHLHIIPRENTNIQEITSPNLKSKGLDMSDVWKSFLKEPFRYKVLSPEELLLPLKDNQSLKYFFDYLKKRYFEKYQ